MRSVLQREKGVGGGGCEKQTSAEEILKVYVWIREWGSTPIQQIRSRSKELPKMAEFSRLKAAGCGSFFKEGTVSGKVTCLWGQQGSVRQIASPVPTRSCQMVWFKTPLPGEVESAIK